MKLCIKILKTTIIIAAFLIVILFTVSFLLQDKVAGIILKSLNKSISTKFEFKTVRLSFLRRFPNATLELSGVLVHSSPGFDPASFSGSGSDTLLSAKAVSADFKITDLIKGAYNIGRIGIKDGRINLLTDSSGNINYRIKSLQPDNQGDMLAINLNRIHVTGTSAQYNNLATKLLIGGAIENGHLKSRISGDNIDFSTDALINIDKFGLYRFSISRDLKADFKITLHSSRDGILFDKSSIKLDGYDFTLQGFISADNVLDLALKGDRIDISKIKDYLPGELCNKIDAFNPSGILDIDCKLKGAVSHIMNPGIDISFNLIKGKIISGNSPLTINDLSFNGFFTNGTLRDPESSSLTVKDFSGLLGSARYTGSFSLNDFNALKGNLYLKGTIIPSEIKEFFNLKQIASSQGEINFNLHMNGQIVRKVKYSISDILRMHPEANLDFNSFGFIPENHRFDIDHVNGNLLLADTTRAKNLSFTFNGQEFNTTGTFLNFFPWLRGQPVNLTFAADLQCPGFNPDSLFKTPVRNENSHKSIFIMPSGMIFDVNLKIGRFSYKTCTADNVEGILSYKPGILNFKTLRLNSLDGFISGNGFIAQGNDNSFVGRGTFDLEKINVKKAFISFGNFGQSFIVADNLDGILSGSLSVLIPLDSMFRPVVKAVTADGKYVIQNGSLKNFEPVKALSNYIELSELEDISFQTLENDFFIRNNFLYIPQMDVKSSAADLSVNGKHGFDNKYEYHVKVRLSEILSRKVRKPKANTTEFGAIQDDGLGRTSLLLRIENKGPDVKVNYDIKAAEAQLRENIRNERQNFKSILNQEYGWFKKDSTIAVKQKKSTPGVRIIFDGDEISQSDTAETDSKNENGIRKLFRKKN